MKKSMKYVLMTIAIIFPILTLGQVSAEIQDSDIVCTMEYAPVCGMPYFECPQDGNIPVVCARPMDVTYSNMCVLEAAGATLQYKGVCEHDKPKACPENYDPVCGKTQAKVCLSLDCAQRNQTYSNTCFLEVDNAEFLYEGECKTQLPEETDGKYYVGDSEKCKRIRYMCEDGWDGFTDKIGCGCEKKEEIEQELPEKTDTKYYVATNIQCPNIFYTCDMGYRMFDDSLGCGCVLGVSPEVQQRIDNILDSFISRLEAKNYSSNNMESIIYRLSERLQQMRKSKPEYENIIYYTLQKLDSYE